MLCVFCLLSSVFVLLFCLHVFFFCQLSASLVTQHVFQCACLIHFHFTSKLLCAIAAWSSNLNTATVHVLYLLPITASYCTLPMCSVFGLSQCLILVLLSVLCFSSLFLPFSVPNFFHVSCFLVLSLSGPAVWTLFLPFSLLHSFHACLCMLWISVPVVCSAHPPASHSAPSFLRQYAGHLGRTALRREPGGGLERERALLSLHRTGSLGIHTHVNTLRYLHSAKKTFLPS